MQRYVVAKQGANRAPSRSSSSLVQQVFQAPAEMELRALVSALELGEASQAQARAKALLQRVRRLWHSSWHARGAATAGLAVGCCWKARW